MRRRSFFEISMIAVTSTGDGYKVVRKGEKGKKNVNRRSMTQIKSQNCHDWPGNALKLPESAAKPALLVVFPAK